MTDRNDHFPFDTPPPDTVGENYQFRQPAPKAGRATFDAGLSLTRLVVGGVLWSMDTLMDRLLTWDTIRRQARGELPAAGGQMGSGNGQGQDSRGEPIVPQLHYQYSDNFIRGRHTVVGMVFASRSAVLNGLQRLAVLQVRVYRRLSTAAAPLLGNGLSGPLQQRLEGLVRRGEREVSNLERIGKRESEISRELVQTAVHETVEDSIEYLAENPEVKELVQTQSTGLADEAVEEIRERAVSADNFVEGLVRYFLRRMPRQEIPPPPSDVRDRAERLHPERYQKQKRQP